jgi:outer membrane protein insertion porin family
VNTRYQLGYLNPYYTDDGIARGFNVFYRATDARDANLALYETKEYGGSVSFRVPISEHNTIGTELSYANTELDLETSTSQQLNDFVAENGDKYNLLRVSASFTYDTRNKRVLPDKGTLASISTRVSLPSFGDSLQFYKIDLKTQWFKDIYKDFVLTLGADIGYGDSYGDTSELPFFENFFAGGPRSVRGFEENTLGPRDSSNRSLGGDTRIVGNAEVIIPVPFFSDFKDSIRITGFIDAGNVYGPDESFDLGDLRYSTGMSAIWISPFGAVSASISQPINEQSRDEVQNFQFTFGTSF